MAMISGSTRRDRLAGTTGDDEFHGYNGDDIFLASSGNDFYDGGTGIDTVDYSTGKVGKAGIVVDLRKGRGVDGEGYAETYVSIENIIGSSAADEIRGNQVANVLSGGGGDDYLSGEGGRDELHGDAGNDRLVGGADDDLLDGGSENDTLIGGAGADTLDGGTGVDTVSYSGSLQRVDVSLWTGAPAPFYGDAAGDAIYNVENLTGTSYDDFLEGDQYGNVLRGEDGNDVLRGGGGADVLDGGGGFDTASYYYASIGVRADLLVPANSSGDAADDTWISIEGLSGSGHDDTLLGDDAPNSIEGLNGRDSLYGRGGDDRLFAAPDDFLVDGGSGVDEVYLSSFSPPGQHVGYTVTLGSAGDGWAVSSLGSIELRSIENVFGSDRDDTLLGNDAANTLNGTFGVDVIDGRGGSDTLFGGFDSDTFVFDHLGQSNRNQHDVIGDFHPGLDYIDLSATSVQDFNDLLTVGDRYMEQVGNDVLIHTSVSADTSILLRYVQLASLTSADFQF